MDDLRRLTRWCSDRSVPQVLAATALALVVFRAGPVVLGRPPARWFLVLNLVLAWIPFASALAVDLLRRRRGAALAAGAVWLLFLPNAPYLVSDLTHFDRRSATPWFDLSLFVSFGWAGCLLAVTSMRIVHQVVRAAAGPVAGWSLIVGAALASGFGVALGRFERLNSWEAVSAPSAVLDGVARLWSDQRSLALAVFFGLLVLTIYACTAQPGRRIRS